MPRGTHHDIVGVLLEGDGLYPILHEAGGGQWRLDMSSRHAHLFGRCVRVIGRRCDFDMLDVERIEEA